MRKKHLEKDHLFDVKEAAGFLGVNAGTIRRWAQNERLQGIKLGTRGDWRFAKKELLKMISPTPGVRQEWNWQREDTLSQKQVLLVNGLAPQTSWRKIHDRSHFVHYYDNDTFLLSSLIDFVTAGDAAIVIAGKDHRMKLEDGLRAKGINVDAPVVNGKYTVLDAAEMLSRFMVNAMPDPDLFFEIIGGIIMRMARKSKRIHIYGEMVALLWAEGNQIAAIRLEELWNELQKTLPFSLFCAYPMSAFNKEKHMTPFAQVNEIHSGVLPVEGYSALRDDDERLRTIAELQQKAMALQNEVIRRKKVERQRNEFMGIVSHELKTPVTSIKVFAELLERKLKQDGHSYAINVVKMRTQINKLNVLIDDLLDLTRLEEGKIQFREEFFSFDDLVSEIIEEVSATDTKHLVIKQGNVKKQIFADRERVGQVLTNLLTNAMKYSPDDEKIIVTVSADSQEVVCSVQDFGVGISKDEQSYIFDRFYREAGENQATFPGLGLGLYISSQIVKRHGGRIWVKSDRGEGSTFYFSLPISKRRRSK